MRGKMMKKLFISLLISIFFIGCSSSDDILDSSEYKLLRVTDFNFTLRDKQAVSIAVGKDDSHYFDITVHRDQIKNNAVIVREYPDTAYENTVIDATATMSGDYYIFLIKDDIRSLIGFKINTLDYEKKEANVDIYIKVIEPYTEEYLTLDKPGLKIQGKMFDNLVKKIKG
jgi:predicted transcriptional regulator